MNTFSLYLDQFLFGVLPYIALMLFFVGTVYRYKALAFSYSSLSSQLLENQQHFWALVPFHYGIITIAVAHFAAFVVPRQVLLWNRVPLRLYILEVGGLTFGITTLIGLAAMVVRRLTDRRVRVVTSAADWIVYTLLFISVLSGLYTALFHRWGSSWFAVVAAPYLWSVFKLNPAIAAISAMPWSVKVHVVNAWIVFGFFPFSRLVHILVTPNPYFWRKRQVVRWYRGPASHLARSKG
jgi:nitrate reductase gamma subunit